MAGTDRLLLDLSRPGGPLPRRNSRPDPLSLRQEPGGSTMVVDGFGEVTLEGVTDTDPLLAGTFQI